MDSVAVGDVGADSEEPPGGARGGALRRVGLSGHAASMRLRICIRTRACRWRCRSRMVTGVHGSTSTGVPSSSTATKTIGHWAFEGFWDAPDRANRQSEYVDTGAPRVDDAGVQVDEFAGADGPVEVEVGDVGGHTVSATPLRGDGAACFVYPFQKRRAVHDSDHADIGRPHTEALNQRVARSIGRRACCVECISADLLCRWVSPIM